jgi:phosphoribosylformylglycinamidine synthase
MKAQVYVTLKKEVLDPQGDAVRRALESLGFQGVSGVRVGKYIEVDLDEQTGADDARTQIDAMCAKLLANPVIEDFRYDLEES